MGSQFRDYYILLQGQINRIYRRVGAFNYGKSLLVLRTGRYKCCDSFTLNFHSFIIKILDTQYFLMIRRCQI